MKRMITTAGLAALGAASIAPTLAQDATIQQKPWSIGASLKGFYDDNYFTLPKALREAPGFDDNTFGFDISPTAAVNFKRDQTTFGLSYLYTFRYYIDRPSPRDDHAHQANMKFSHAFNERYSVDIKDSFVLAQEPAVLDPTISTTFPARAEGDNFRNYGSIQFNAGVAENFHIDIGYSNSIYDYEQENTDVVGGVGSRSSVLDRLEHMFFLNGNYQVLPKTTVTLGYQYGILDYTSDDLIGLGTLTGSVRDSKSHFATLGVKQHLNPQLDVSARAGVQFTTYDNETVFTDDRVSPYAEASARWGYMQDSSLQVGVRHQRIPTDVRLIAGALVADQEATSIYVSVNQAITAKITGVAMVQYQHSDYESATGESSDEIFYAGATVGYQFTPHIAGEVGYTFDRVDSDFGLRSFTRNRVFVGARFSY